MNLMRLIINNRGGKRFLKKLLLRAAFFIGIYYDCITLRLALELKTKIESF